jgi:dolichol-phosphate mannosyltransferase
MKIAIAGANGFIGANLTRFFSRDGYDVYPLIYKNSWRLGKGRYSKNIARLDTTKRHSTIIKIKKINPDVVINTSVFGGYPWQADKLRIFDINLRGTGNLLEASIEANSRLFIQTGTSAEYGLQNKLMREDTTPKPETDYAVSKLLATKTVVENEKMRSVVIRIFSAYGYFEEKRRLIPQLILNGINGTEAMLTSKHNVRDFVFIEDIYEAYRKAIEFRGKKNEIFNIGGGKQYSLDDVVNIYKSEVGRLNAVWGNETIRSEDKARIWMADVRKSMKLLSWSPKVNLPEGLKKTRKWFKENIDLYS